MVIDDAARQLAEAFSAIETTLLLKNAILDGKSEGILTQALATSLNHRERIARTEVGRVDLAVFPAGVSSVQQLGADAADYWAEAKFAYLCQLAEPLPTTEQLAQVDDWLRCDLTKKDKTVRSKRGQLYYCGYGLRLDLEKRTQRPHNMRDRLLGLFYIAEVDPPSAQAKDRKPENAPLHHAESLVSGWVGLPPRDRASLDFGSQWGAAIRVHLLVYAAKDATPRSE